MRRAGCSGVLAACVAAAVAAAAPAAAQTWPVKPVKIVVPFTPGSGTDVIARAVSDKLGAALGQSVLVEKRSTRDPGEFTGRTENMRYVNFAGPPRMVGRFVDVLVTEVMANSLRGRVVHTDDIPAGA